MLREHKDGALQAEAFLVGDDWARTRADGQPGHVGGGKTRRVRRICSPIAVMRPAALWQMSKDLRAPASDSRVDLFVAVFGSLRGARARPPQSRRCKKRDVPFGLPLGNAGATAIRA